jgi:hypothetical protein
MSLPSSGNIRKKPSLVATFYAGFSFAYFFGPEDGEEIFPRNACRLSTDYTESLKYYDEARIASFQIHSSP